MSRKLPLQTVLQHRERLLDEAKGSLGRDLDAERSAELQLRAREAHAQQVAETSRRTHHQELLIATTPRDFAQIGAFLVGASERNREAEANVQVANAQKEAAVLAMEESRRILLAKRAELEVVERLRERARQAADNCANQALDEAAEEAFAGRTARPG